MTDGTSETVPLSDAASAPDEASRAVNGRTSSSVPVTAPGDAGAAVGDDAVAGIVPPDGTSAAPDAGGPAGPTITRSSRRNVEPGQLEREGDIAADYLEGLLDIADLDGDIDMDVDGDRAAVSIVGADLNELVGSEGQVLEALQELTRLAVQARTGERSRLMLDIAGHRAARRAELSQLGAKAAGDAASSGKPVRLAPMSPFERKVVHDAVAAAGQRSESEGDEPQRRVVVLPTA